ncbi:MAG: T9SS type A sorting domain-containing protein, partial [Prevotella sp.]|nr:T9SS type A sorting domain-containing protein [Prevotella sp.]
IDDVDGNAIALYPNPASTTVTIAGMELQSQIVIVDMNGREVYRANAADGSVKVDVSNLSKGAYFVRITGEKTNAIRKLVVK